MMGRQSSQMSMLILDMEEMIPENHLLRKINRMVSFDFIYDLAAPYYPANGRPSVDPVSMIKMLLVGYLYGNIKGRLVKLLKSYNTVMPGCYHEGCEITELTVKTNNYTHFSQIKDLAEAYLFMADRAKELFYRLWDTELPEYEAREYNFLVSFLGMRDVGYSPDRPIYYDLARKFAPVYKQEGYSDYSSYIMYRGADFSAFYTCKEFFDCPELVEKLAQEFPTMKAAFGDMALSAKSFLCSFVWSDEPSCCKVYVPKTKDELHGDEKYIAICEHLSAPASQGGIELSIPEWKQKHDSYIKRVMARYAGGNQHG